MDITFWLVLGTFFLVLVSLARSQSGSTNGSHSRRLEQKVDLIMHHLGLDPNLGADEKIVELMKAGQKIEAIKLYREQTGAGLKEAKDYVETLA